MTEAADQRTIGRLEATVQGLIKIADDLRDGMTELAAALRANSEQHDKRLSALEQHQKVSKAYRAGIAVGLGLATYGGIEFISKLVHAL